MGQKVGDQTFLRDTVTIPSRAARDVALKIGIPEATAEVYELLSTAVTVH